MTGRALRTETVGAFSLESGVQLANVRVGYHLDGPATAHRDEAVVVLHALTGNADAAGDWWRGVVGAGKGIDTDRCTAVAPNLLGSCHGTSYTSSGAALPAITTRDQARVIAILLERLGIRSVSLATGGSLGGMVALELAASHPGLVQRVVAFGAVAVGTPWAIAWNHVQRRVLDLGGADALAVAREIAMISFRAERGFGERFGAGGTGAAAVTGWLRHHGAALSARFDVRAYRTLLGAMDTHDVTRGRGSLRDVLGGTATTVWGVGIAGDRLYSPGVVQAWVDQVGGVYRRLETAHGHDGFLIEQDEVGAILRDAIAAATGADVRTEPRPTAREAA